MRPSTDREQQPHIHSGPCEEGLKPLWYGQEGQHTQGEASRALPESTDKFLTQVIEEPTVGHSVLDLILTKKEGLPEDMKDTGSLKLQ